MIGAGLSGLVLACIRLITCIINSHSTSSVRELDTSTIFAYLRDKGPSYVINFIGDSTILYLLKPLFSGKWWEAANPINLYVEGSIGKCKLKT